MGVARRDYARIAERYARRVVSGRQVAGRLIRLACQRHLDDLKRQRDPAWPYRFRPKYANDVCAFIECLPHVEGVWEEPEIVLQPWQIWLLCCVFGWRLKEDEGVRRFTDVYEEVARKNAKSTIAAAVGLYCLACEGEPGCQVKCAATTGDQARIVFNIAKRMVEQTPDLRVEFGVEPYANAIACQLVAGNMQPINSKSSTQDGLNPHLAILDELHAHKDRGLYDVLRSARGARRSPLTWIVTTAGYNLEGVCYEQRKLAAKVLEGAVEADHIFAAIYTLDYVGDEDNDDDPFDEAAWPKANPNLGVSLFLRDMRAYAVTAKESPDSEQEFKTKRLNLWEGAKAPWISIPMWRACGHDFDVAEMEGMEAFGGLDLASVADTASFNLCFPWEGGIVRSVSRIYVPEAQVKARDRRGNPLYLRWQRSGHLIVTPGDTIDYDYIERDIREALGRFLVRGIAFDPWNAYDIVNRLSKDEAPMVEFRQGPKSYAPAMREFERRLKSRTLHHDSNPAMRWMASNLVVRKDVNDNMAPDKKNSEDKIDGVVALIMALGLCATLEVDKGVHVPDDYSAAVA